MNDSGKSNLIYADYGKYDRRGRIILTCLGTRRDLDRYGITLRSGMALTFYMDSDLNEDGTADNLLVNGIVAFDPEENRWVATIDESTFRHESEPNE
jgi:hypothetical protein